MKMLILAVLLFSSTAFATPGGEGNNSGCNGVGNANSPCSTTDSGNSHVENTNISTSRSGAYSRSVSSGGDAFSNSTSTGGEASSNSTSTGGNATGGNVTITNNTPSKVRQEVEYRGRLKNTPDVGAPALATGGDEVCMGSTSAGVAGPGFGISAGGTWTDENCNMRRNAALLYNMGHTQTANMLICADEKIAAAFAASGEFACPVKPTPVAADRDLYR